ncbi:MAG: phosphoglycerate dehydrogenase [Actinobacteria bacterium]|nr:phosphoglycerate dehydrogenase [Actinomycetota bacterium]
MASSGRGCSESDTSATTTSSTSRPCSLPSRCSSPSAGRRSSVVPPSAAHSTRTANPSVSDKPRVLIRESIAESGLDVLRSRFEVVEDSESELGSIIGEFDAIVVRSGTTIDAELIERASRLKVIGRAGVGVDNVDVDAATRRGIVVANAPEATVVSAAEHTMALLLAVARNVPQAHAALIAGRWERARFAGIELAGKTLGVLGFGRIGRQVARRALGLGMRVVAYDPYVALDRFRELGVESAPSPEDLYAQADLITLHLPLNEQTNGLLGTVAFARMRDGVRIVNAARGGLIDEDALVIAVRSGKVAGAALDVFESEPYSGPLLELQQVVVTPHLAGSTTEAQDRAGLIIAEQVVAALDGELVQTAVNIPVVEQADLEVLGPFIPLAAKLGRLAIALVSFRPARIVVAAHGPLSEYDTRLLTVAALNGVFQGRVDQTVNYVNAPVIAAERGIDVSEQRFAASQHYTNLVRVVVAADGEEIEVSGTTIGPESRLFLAGALGFAIDIELAPRMAFFIYDDVPGVIGKVGVMFGEAGVNIANMAVSRTKEGGKALMAFSIDSAVPPELVERVTASGFDEARFIFLG